MIEQSPILITGCARSGTSIVAKIVNLCGAFGGSMSKIYENITIQDGVVKTFLNGLKVDPLGQWPLPDVSNMPIPSNWGNIIESVMIQQGYQKGPWMLKDTKMNLMWPVWNYAYPNAKWIIVRRKTPEIIRSCMQTGFMNAFDCEGCRQEVGVSTSEEGWLWWIHQQENRFVEMIQAGMDVKQIWPERMVRGDYEQIKDMIRWLGLIWRDDILSIIDPMLWNTRKKEERSK